MSYGSSPLDYEPNQKVWFLGFLKAKVAQGSYQRWIEESGFRGWGVPIIIKGSGCVTIAHVDDLTPRGKKK